MSNCACEPVCSYISVNVLVIRKVETYVRVLPCGAEEGGPVHLTRLGLCTGACTCWWGLVSMMDGWTDNCLPRLWKRLEVSA